MAIKTLIWDFDGTLCNSYPAIGDCYLEALKTLGHSVDQEWVQALLHESMSRCESILSETYSLAPDELNQEFHQYYKLLNEDTHPPFPGVGELCKYILAHDGKNLMVTHRGRKSILKIMEYYDLQQYFTDFITSDDNFPRKPDPAAFIAILERNNIDRSTALGIGDREIDILAAHGAGIRACLFSPDRTFTTADFSFSDYSRLQNQILEEAL
ncbi:MAG: HAD-IA family hydrolase [Anaerolineales bacterium]|nr:HAD-IA family hydrolase [Anaerolineales bacterium]